MKILEVEGISKSFGDFKAVDNISFSIEEGSIFGLLGPNGAGKTTTIRMIMNIIIPDSGKISMIGNSNPDKITHLIGYLPEERGLYKKMHVDELLLFLTKLKSMPRKEARRSIDSWLERMDISGWKKKKLEELSKGMQQKVQFIGTILHNPKLLILDEPFGGLDPINTNLIKDIILELKNNGTTIIFSTHIMESAEKLCNEILLINKGQKVLSGNLNTIKSEYGKKNIILKYEGNGTFLKNSSLVNRIDDYGQYVEVQLNENADHQEFLKEAVLNARIQKFELKEPSLNEIFLNTIAESNQGAQINE